MYKTKYKKLWLNNYSFISWKKDHMVYIRLIRPLIHIIVIICCFVVVYNLRQYTDLIPYISLPIPYINFQEIVIFIAICAVVFVTIWFILRLYKLFGPIHWYHKTFFKVFIVWFVCITFIAYFGHWFIFANWISRFIILWWSLLSFFLILIIDIIINLFNNRLESQNPYHIAVITFQSSYFENIKNNFKKYKIYVLHQIDPNNLKISDLKKYDIVLTVWNIDIKQFEEIVDFTRLSWIYCYHIPESSFLNDIIYSHSRLWPIIVWEYKPSPLDWWWRASKRLFDIGFSVIVIMTLWLLYIFITIFIYLKDWRPILIRSKRVWKRWKVFVMYKFRSMVKGADKLKKQLMNQNEREWPLFKIEDDPRILPWWKFLRKTSLDEIPQFFNILKWEMSVVWPRPHLIEEVKNYKWWQKRLLSLKPWLTWYAQIFGRDLPFDKEAQLDLYWIANRSIWMDIFVVVGTLKTIFKGK